MRLAIEQYRQECPYRPQHPRNYHQPLLNVSPHRNQIFLGSTIHRITSRNLRPAGFVTRTTIGLRNDQIELGNYTINADIPML